jgi:hypothetical protein
MFEEPSSDRFAFHEQTLADQLANQLYLVSGWITPPA